MLKYFSLGLWDFQSPTLEIYSQDHTEYSYTLSTQKVYQHMKSANGSQYFMFWKFNTFKCYGFLKSHDYPNSCVKFCSYLQRKDQKKEFNLLELVQLI